MNVNGNVINAMINLSAKCTSVVFVYTAFFIANTSTIISTMDIKMSPSVMYIKNNMKYFLFQKPTQLFTHGQ